MNDYHLNNIYFSDYSIMCSNLANHLTSVVSYATGGHCFRHRLLNGKRLTEEEVSISKRLGCALLCLTIAPIILSSIAFLYRRLSGEKKQVCEYLPETQAVRSLIEKESYQAVFHQWRLLQPGFYAKKSRHGKDQLVINNQLVQDLIKTNKANPSNPYTDGLFTKFSFATDFRKKTKDLTLLHADEQTFPIEAHKLSLLSLEWCSLGGEKGYAKKTKSGKIKLLVKEKFLGLGSLGIVHSVTKYTYNSKCQLEKKTANLALKKALEKGERPDINNECVKVENLKDRPGIQKQLKKIRLHSRKKGKRVGTLGFRYECDLLKAYQAGKLGSHPLEKLKKLSPLLLGLRSLKEKGIFHGDIKPANCFFDHGTSYIGDFGGALTAKELLPWYSIFSFFGFFTSFTPLYANKTDLEKIKEAYRKRDKEKLFKYEHQRDIFAMGLTLCESLMQGRPEVNTTQWFFGQFKVCDITSQNLKVIDQKLNAIGIPDKCRECILNMLDPDPDKRKDISELIQLWDLGIKSLSNTH